MSNQHPLAVFQPVRMAGRGQQFFDRVLHESDADQSNVVTSQWTPAWTSRRDRALPDLADIPGVEPADIEVQMDKGILTIRASATP